MRNKIIFLGIVLFIISGIMGLNLLGPNEDIPQKQSSMLPEYTENNLAANYNQKEGWGFVKSKNGKLPEVTAHQRDLVKKYNALFLGDTNKKQVTVTFDMGYEKEGLTPKILETLKKHKVKASFFVTTHWIEKKPELAKKVLKDGHILGNHTVRHKSLPTLPDEEVKKEILGWEEIAEKVTGYNNKYKYMRPPMGEYSERTLKITHDLGYRTAFWSIAIKDWLPMEGPQEAVKGITNQLHNGAVILLHGNSQDVADGLDEILTEIKEKGYKIVPIYEI